jgi:hypothetical protein
MTTLSTRLPCGSRNDIADHAGRVALQTATWSIEEPMREFGVRRYGDTLYHHCLADAASDAAGWFAHSHSEVAGKDFQALVKDLSKPVTDETGLGENPSVVAVRHGDRTEGSRNAKGLDRTSLVLSERE